METFANRVKCLWKAYKWHEQALDIRSFSKIKVTSDYMGRQPKQYLPGLECFADILSVQTRPSEQNVRERAITTNVHSRTLTNMLHDGISVHQRNYCSLTFCRLDRFRHTFKGTIEKYYYKMCVSGHRADISRLLLSLSTSSAALITLTCKSQS